MNVPTGLITEYIHEYKDAILEYTGSTFFYVGTGLM